MATMGSTRSSRLKSAGAYLAARPLETMGVLVTAIGVVIALHSDAVMSAIKNMIPPQNQSPISATPVESLATGFEKAEDEFHVQLAKLQRVDIGEDDVKHAMGVASADISNCKVWLRILRGLDPNQEVRWKTFESRVVDDEDLLAHVSAKPGETVDGLDAAYQKARHDFITELGAGEDLLEAGPPDGGGADYAGVDRHFTAAQRAFEQQKIVLGRLRQVAPSRVDSWNADKHDIETEADRLNSDWNLFEAHDGSEATTSYLN